MSTGRQLLVIALCFLLFFLWVRSFFAGIKHYRLNNSMHKKTKKGETFWEWLLYSRYKTVIPTFLQMWYYWMIIIHIMFFSSCILLYYSDWTWNSGELLAKIILVLDIGQMILVNLLFWTPRRGFAYSRWIRKKQKKKNDKSKEKNKSNSIEESDF